MSGSDYGERKILLWDAKYPHFHDPAKFPHVLFWNSAGLIRKILIRKESPKPGFWLAQHQLSWVVNDKALDIWPGELSEDDKDIEDDEEEEEEDEEEDGVGESRKSKKQSGDDEDDHEDQDILPKKKKVDLARIGDVIQYDGVFMEIIKVTSEGERESASDYNPGGNLIIKIQVKMFVANAIVDIDILLNSILSFSI